MGSFVDVVSCLQEKTTITKLFGSVDVVSCLQEKTTITKLFGSVIIGLV